VSKRLISMLGLVLVASAAVAVTVSRGAGAVPAGGTAPGGSFQALTAASDPRHPLRARRADRRHPNLSPSGRAAWPVFLPLASSAVAVNLIAVAPTAAGKL